jgi:hypothetical protein
VQAQAFMHAALEEQRVGAHTACIVRMCGAPGNDIVEGMGGGIGGTVRTGLQVERDLAHHQVGRDLDLVFVAQQHRQHITGQGVLGDLAGSKPRQQITPAQHRGAVEGGVELCQRRAHLGPHHLLVAGGVHQGGTFAEGACEAAQTVGLFGITAWTVDAGEVGSQVHGDAIPQLDQVGMAPFGMRRH